MHSNDKAIIVNIKPIRDNIVGISEKNNIPKSIAAIGSPPEARIETFPVSI
ncbi:hypothetical protein CNEO2_490002 [Clostridium neonatale]|nr:hypothetical protein CNEO4_130003 [Clostridium neonatale]CAI3691418.1 hypothetical protein CNEO2_490002 [Clostridium neonatale]